MDARCQTHKKTILSLAIRGPESEDNEGQNRGLLLSNSKQALANHPERRCHKSWKKTNFDLTWKWALIRSATLPYGIKGVTNHTLLRVSYQTSLEPIYKRGLDKLEKAVPPYQQQRLQGSAECWHVEKVSSFLPEVNWFNQFSRNQNHQNFSNLSKPHD